MSYKYLILIIIFLFFGCSDDELPNSGPCDMDDKEVILGDWGNPGFISDYTNCHLDECLEMSFTLNSDSTYQLSYSVSDFLTDSILREVNDFGRFQFDCLEAGNLSGRYSFLTYVEGEVTLNSDSISQIKKWNLQWNGYEGLVIQPEYLGFTHEAYIMLGPN